MPSAALLSLALLASPQTPAPWQYHRLGETGLRLLLPKAPEADPADKERFSLQHEGLTVEIKARPANLAQPLPETERYLATLEPFRKEYGRRITSLLNEADVVSAVRFGATHSIGFVLEAEGNPSVAFGWHLVRIDGYDYEITVRGEKKHRPWVTLVLDSQQYVSRETGKFPSGPIGKIGIQSLLGPAFLSLTGADSEVASSFVLQGDNIPVVGVAQLWDSTAVDYSTANSVLASFVKQLTSSNIAQNPVLKVEESTLDGKKSYRMEGEVFVTDRKVACQGIAVVFEGHAASIVLLYDPADKPTADLAREILASVKPTPPEAETDGRVGLR